MSDTRFYFNRSLYFVVFVILLLYSQKILSQQPSYWESRGPGGGGAFFGPSINPANPNEFYVTTDMSGVYRTTDYGLNYSMLHFSKLLGGSLARIQYTSNPNIRYFLDHSSAYLRPVKSTNGGQTWAALPGNPSTNADIYGIFVDYAMPNRIVMNNWGSIYFSNNGGTSFSTIHTAENSNQGCHLAGVFFDGQNIYVATNDGLLVSTNGGASFSDQNYPGLPAGESLFKFCGAKVNGVTRFFGLAAPFAEFYGGIDGASIGSIYTGIYRLDYLNSGSQWTLKTNGVPAGSSFVCIGMAENDLNTVYVSGRSHIDLPTVFKTTNSGNSWTESFKAQNNVNVRTGYMGHNGDFHWYWAAVFFDMDVAKFNKNRVIVTDYGLVHKTLNGGATWLQAYTNAANENPAGASTPIGKNYNSISLENTSIWQVVWMDSLNLFGCWTDIKGARSQDGGLAWNFNYTGHDLNTMYQLVKHNTQNIWYAATASVHDLYETTYLKDAQIDPGTGRVIFTTNMGATWQTLHNFGKVVCWVATDPTNVNRLYASVVHSHPDTGGIWKTDNLQNGAASTWTKLPNPPRTEGHPYNIHVLNDGKVVVTYSGRRTAAGNFTASSGVFLYDPANNSWSDRSHTGMYYYTKDIVIDPNDPVQNTWYACVWSGWGGPPDTLGGIYRSTNRGLSWTKINNQERVHSATFQPGNPNKLIYTTELEGLWYSPNINASSPTFVQMSNYPFRSPRRVFFNPFKPSEMWVCSFGNGIRVGAEPVCSPPASAWSENVAGQNTKKNIFWAHIFGASSYQIQYRVANPEGPWITRTVTLNKILLENLLSNTTYDFRIRARCASGLWTAWSATSQFNTPAVHGVEDRNAAQVIDDQLLVFPNPASEQVEIRLVEKNMASLIVTDALGRTYFFKKNPSEIEQLDVRTWPSGIFEIWVEKIDGTRISKRLVKTPAGF